MDLHIHSTYSDGNAEIHEIARKARERGMKVIAIADHSMDHPRGLNERKARRREVEIRTAEEKIGIRILDAVECAILENGEILLPDHDFELVIASIHSHLSVREVCRRVKLCIEKNDVHIIGHLHAGMFSVDSSISEFDLEIVDAAKESGVAIEINSYHMSPPESFLRLCSGKEILYSFGSDAHNLSMVGKIDFSIRMAKIYLRDGRNIVNEMHYSDR